MAWPDMVMYTVVLWKVQRISEELWSIKLLSGSCVDEKIMLPLCGKQKK
jgi:hypothetical protein